jgi:hypothetical protein
LAALCSFLCSASFAQQPLAPALAHAWPEEVNYDPAWDLLPTDRTIVLDDSLSIRLRNNKAQFLAVFFERHKVIRFANTADIARHGRIILPESLDPPYDQRIVPWEHRSHGVRSLWWNTRLDHIGARVIRADGSWREVRILGSMLDNQQRTPFAVESAHSHRLDLADVEPGDVVEIHWKYMLPYDSNWPASAGWRDLQWMDNWARLTNWRVFFHGELPVRQQHVELLYSLKHGLIVSGPAPSARREKGNEVVLEWRNADLPGCINEVNARPAEELPHLTFRLEPEDLRYWQRDRLTGILMPNPYWMKVVRMRQWNAFWWHRVARKRIPDRQNQLFKDFVRRTALGVPDSLAARQVATVHDHIAQYFTYEDDLLWYLDLDRGNARIGDQVKDGRLRDISRYDLYAKLIELMRLHYSTSYTLDKRIGRMDDHYLTPLWDSEFIFGVADRHDMFWMHPKQSRYGWLANELPFYWQGTQALHVDFDVLFDDLERPPLFVWLPKEDPAGTTRGVEYALDVDLGSTTADGMSRVFLSGQFSTLGRASYLGAATDSTVNPRYGWRPDQVPGITTRAWGKADLSTDPPFRFRTSAGVVVRDLVAAQGDTLWTISAAPLLSHAVEDRFRAEGRHMHFHWDFRMTDQFRIELNFSEDVQLVETPGTDTHRTGQATLERRVWQRGPRKLVLESRLEVTGEREDPADHEALEALIRAADAEWNIRLKALREAR